MDHTSAYVRDNISSYIHKKGMEVKYEALTFASTKERADVFFNLIFGVGFSKRDLLDSSLSLLAVEEKKI